MLRKWEELPEKMQTEAVRPYYEYLNKKRGSLMLKRAFDVIVSVVLLIVLSPIVLVLSIMIITDSKGGVFYRQERVTQYGRTFRIFKFQYQSVRIKIKEKVSILCTANSFKAFTNRFFDCLQKLWSFQNSRSLLLLKTFQGLHLEPVQHQLFI